MGPIVLILSYGSAKPIEIVQQIQAAKNNSSDLCEPFEIVLGETKFLAHKHSIKNKYFETTVNLLPFDEPINIIPIDILKKTEAIIVAFDSSDKSFLIHIPKLCELVENNKIELSLLLTSELKDDYNEGLTYADIKDVCKTSFDVLETQCSDEDDETIKTANEHNYSEVIEALENHVWSNIASPSCSKKKPKPESTDDNDKDDDLDTDQLEAYENLLTNIVNFKSNSANLNRDQVLDQAEKLAEMFSTFMGDD